MLTFELPGECVYISLFAAGNYHLHPVAENRHSLSKVDSAHFGPVHSGWYIRLPKAANSNFHPAILIF